jgi:hypothetical protein
MTLKVRLYTFYYVYNLLFGIFSVYFLIYAALYITPGSISTSTNGGKFIHYVDSSDVILFTVLIIGSLLLMSALFCINKYFLIKTKISDNYKLLAKRTTLLISIFPLIPIGACIYYMCTHYGFR